ATTRSSGPTASTRPSARWPRGRRTPSATARAPSPSSRRRCLTERARRRRVNRGSEGRVERGVAPAEPIAVYVHWPYCARICPYCDFNVVRDRGRIDEQAALAAAILDDLEAQAARLGPRRLE